MCEHGVHRMPQEEIQGQSRVVQSDVQYRAKLSTCDSAMGILPVVLPVLRYMVLNVSMILTRTIVVKAFTRRISTVSKRATLHYRL